MRLKIEKGSNMSDVAMLISPEDFPCNEKIATGIILHLHEIYRDDALMAMMSTVRGCCLMSDTSVFTQDMLDEFLDTLQSKGG